MAMASLPKPSPEWVPMTAEELLAIRGTPEFEAELRRQMQALAEHQRKHPDELMALDESDMVRWD